MSTQKKMKSERVIGLALIWTKWIPDVFRNTSPIQTRHSFERVGQPITNGGEGAGLEDEPKRGWAH